MLFSKRIKASLRVANTKGIHIRPATNISLLAKEYPQTTMKLSLRGRHANGKNINEILALSAAYQDELLVEIEGPKAKRLLKKLKRCSQTLSNTIILAVLILKGAMGDCYELLP